MKKIWQKIAYNFMSPYYCVAFFLVVSIFFSFFYYLLLPLIEGSPALISNTDSSSRTAVVNYIDCLYFSVTTQTTIGNGDIIPASFLAKALPMVQSVFGYIYLAFLIALFTARAILKSKKTSNILQVIRTESQRKVLP